ncbi:DUF3016 domain-containing protein [Mesorhizobium xinjiangense]|uniref:DUF3016 domain-containing protein n=1 Tax=Mesorhizobium xinjiangense TaxID=2678685 RepID=UPI0012EDE237|nr:DUF3016 domain-containing protein [Mesorhizobium xinjiangense]
MFRLLAAAGALALLTVTPNPSQAAGAVEVVFVHPERYRDIDDDYGAAGGARSLKAVDGYLQYLGERYLKKGQALRVEILNIDLAGDHEPWRGEWRDVRIMRDITPPSFTLRYTLRQNGRPVIEAEERVTDMTYLWGARSVYADRPYGYEKKMLRRWFERRFVRMIPPSG